MKVFSEVKLSGLSRKEIKIDVDYPALVNTGLPLSTVTQAVSASVFSNPAGIIYKGEKEYRVRTETDIRNISDIGNISIPEKEGLKLSGIADIYTGEKNKYSYFHSDGNKCIGIEIFKTGDSGLLNTAERIIKNIPLLEEIFKNDFSVSVIDNASEPLKKTLASLFKAAAAGSFSAVLVLAYIFSSIKTVFIIIMSLPFSLLAVFNFMYFIDISVNVISLTGLIIGTGMVFDNTIVVTEKMKAEKPKEAEDAGRTALETGLSVTGSTLTTILVFIPLLFISGLTGKLFRDLACVVIALITASAVVAMTVPPAFYILFDLKNEKTEYTGKYILKLKSLLRKYHKRKKRNPLIGMLIFTAPLFLVFFLEKEITPSGYDKKVQAFIAYKPGFSASQYSELSSLTEKAILESGLAEKVYVRGGIDIQSLQERGMRENDINRAVFCITGSRGFKGNSSDFAATLEQFFLKTETDSELKINDSFLDRITAGNGNFDIILTASDRKCGLFLISEIKDRFNKSNLSPKISGNFKKNNPQYILEFRRDGFSSAELTPFEISRSLYNSVKGSKAASLDTGEDEETDIVVKYRGKYTDTAEKISALKIPLNEGVFDPDSFTDIRYQENFSNLTRHNRIPCFYISISPSAGEKKETAALLSEYKNRGIKAAGLSAEKDIIKEIIFLFSTALVLIYFFLGAQFESFLIPFYLLLAIPFSISGSFLLLFAAGQSLNISSFLGILILTGTTVNTAIMLFSEKKNNKCSTAEAAEKRIIPAAASILTTAAALVPAAVQMHNPLQASSALTLIGGLSAGGFSVLFLYPLIFDRDKKKCSSLKETHTAESL